MDAASREPLTATEGSRRGASGSLGRRRRPSGQPPPLPREIGVSGRFWAFMAGLLVLSMVFLTVFQSLDAPLVRGEDAFLRWLARLRTEFMNDVMLTVNALGSRWTNRVLRWSVIGVLVVFRRWRHLVTFLATIVVVGWLVGTLGQLLPRPRPLGVEIIGNWEGSAFPSRPVATLAVTVLGICYTLIPHGRYRQWGKWGAGILIGALALARLYLALDHPTDVAVGVILGVSVSLLAYRLFTPSAIFPVSFGRGRSAHLDITGRRGDAIRQAVQDQLSLTVLDMKRFGLHGSGGSTPLRLTVAGEQETLLFGKVYARNHLRADRWYKLGRTIMYGTLEDEKAYNSVRRLVQYEDYILRVMRDADIPTARSFGFVEITPEREYLLVTEFLEGGQEVSEVEVDDAVIDDALATIRRMWDAGLAHRDVKPANILVRDGKVWMIDPAFGQIRPSPWRQAVDLANMMLVLGMKSTPERVYERALRFFTPDEIAEAFSATRSVTMPTQSRGMLREQRKLGNDVLTRFRELAPRRAPISIQRWSVRRVALALGVVLIGLVALGMFLSALSSGAL